MIDIEQIERNAPAYHLEAQRDIRVLIARIRELEAGAAAAVAEAAAVDAECQHILVRLHELEEMARTSVESLAVEVAKTEFMSFEEALEDIRAGIWTPHDYDMWTDVIGNDTAGFAPELAAKIDAFIVAERVRMRTT